MKPIHPRSSQHHVRIVRPSIHPNMIGLKMNVVKNYSKVIHYYYLSLSDSDCMGIPKVFSLSHTPADHGWLWCAIHPPRNNSWLKFRKYRPLICQTSPHHSERACDQVSYPNGPNNNYVCIYQTTTNCTVIYSLLKYKSVLNNSSILFVMYIIAHLSTIVTLLEFGKCKLASGWRNGICLHELNPCSSAVQQFNLIMTDRYQKRLAWTESIFNNFLLFYAYNISHLKGEKKSFHFQLSKRT